MGDQESVIMTSTLMDTLRERDNTHGEFKTHAALSQRLKRAMVDTPGWRHLEPDQREALEMIQHKVARILNGDPDFSDHWHDIAGYSTLVEVQLRKNK